MQSPENHWLINANGLKPPMTDGRWGKNKKKKQRYF